MRSDQILSYFWKKKIEKGINWWAHDYNIYCQLMELLAENERRCDVAQLNGFGLCSFAAIIALGCGLLWAIFEQQANFEFLSGDTAGNNLS